LNQDSEGSTGGDGDRRAIIAANRGRGVLKNQELTYVHLGRWGLAAKVQNFLTPEK